MHRTLIAETGRRFRSFGPFVASVNEADVVAFAATRTDGTPGVFTADGQHVRDRALPSGISAVTSHPDLNGAGDLCFYGEFANGRAVVWASAGPSAADGFAEIGPAGPTMDPHGVVAFRGERVAGTAGIHLLAPDGAVTTVAETGDRFAGFHGLPLIEHGEVVFRADRADGTEGIYRWRAGEISPVVETGGDLRAIAPFPSLGGSGATLFVATSATGRDAAFEGRDGRWERLPGGEAFESHRSVLTTGGGTLIRIATPAGGRLGVFCGTDPERDRIVEVGVPIFRSPVSDLAANAVSVNDAGSIAIRVSLEDGRGMILRADVA